MPRSDKVKGKPKHSPASKQTKPNKVKIEPKKSNSMAVEESGWSTGPAASAAPMPVFKVDPMGLASMDARMDTSDADSLVGSSKPVPISTAAEPELLPLTKKDIAKRREDRLATLKLNNTLNVHSSLKSKVLKKKEVSKKSKKLKEKAQQRAEDFLGQLEAKKAKKQDHTSIKEKSKTFY